MTAKARERGQCKWFDDAKGYGFLARDNGGKDCFVHFSAIESGGKHKTLNDGDRVEFTIVQGEKGPQAANVVVIEAAPKA